VTVRAVSHSAHFAERANLTRAVEAAMNEALDQEGIVVWPPPEDDLPGVARGLITRAHERLAVESRARSLCSVPLAHGGRFCGVVTCERGDDRPFDAGEVELLEAAVALAGPLLDIQRRDDRWIGPKLLDAGRRGVGELLGPRHLGVKLVAGLAACALLLLVLASGEFRVSADARLEAEELRAAVAPFDGYVLEAPVRAGDTVKAGDLLARLDDRDLVLERARWRSELLQLEPQVREAMANRNVSELRALQARTDQARAQLALADGRLAKTRLLAAFDGVVATGDLSQRLGAPVNRGDVLFEVAPLDAYRLALEVDEKDIEELRPGQRGELLFTALPGQSLGFEVETITPVSQAGEGRNAFRVEARLDETLPRLRPGMEGVAKVEIGRRRLLWIWTREAVDSFRLTAWRWLP
jgi:multidrug resistance efflux pump